MPKTTITVQESKSVIAVTENVVEVSVTNNPVKVTAGTSGPQGATGPTGSQGPQGDTGPQGPSGVISVTAPITNSGTSTSAQLGLDQTALAISPSQVTGTAVITTDPRLSDTRTTTNALTLGSGLSGTSFNGSAAVTADVDSTIPRLTATQTFTGAQTLVSSSAADVPLTVRGVSGQSAGLLTLINPAAGTVFAVSNAGRIAGFSLVASSSTGSSNLGAITAYPSGSTVVGQVIRLAASQTADALQIQNSAGSNLLSVSSAGALNVNTSGTGIINLGDGQISKGPGGGFSFNSGLNNLAYVGIGAAGAGSEPLRVFLASPTAKTVIRGAASQTANLQEWQNSAGSILARVSSGGSLVAPSYLTSNGFGTLQEVGNGGVVTLVRAGTVANPGANTARLYFRDGTTAGTLKLVVRAGASGAETTILDNIPQT